MGLPEENHNENPYQGSTFVADDKNAWRYNRYIHRPFKIYYLTETGSGQPRNSLWFIWSYDLN